MAYDRRKIANSFYLPKRPFLSGIASLFSLPGSYSRYYTDQILSRSNADAIRADWEAVGENLWWALGQYEEREKKVNDGE